MASAGAARNIREKDRDVEELERVAEMEKAKKKAALLKLSARYAVPSRSWKVMLTINPNIITPHA